MAVAVLALPGWSLSLTRRLPAEAVALTITSCPRSSGKRNKPLAALAVTHISASGATSSRHSAPGRESPGSSGHGATGCNGPGGCGRRWWEHGRAAAAEHHWGLRRGSGDLLHSVTSALAKPGASRRRPATGSLAGCQWPGKRPRLPQGSLSLRLREQLLALGFYFGLSGCCQAGDERGSGSSSAEGRVGMLWGVPASVA